MGSNEGAQKSLEVRVRKDKKGKVTILEFEGCYIRREVLNDALSGYRINWGGLNRPADIVRERKLWFDEHIGKVDPKPTHVLLELDNRIAEDIIKYFEERKEYKVTRV